MTKLLVCIDGSAYADNICAHAAWVAKRLNAEIDLLHVLRPSSDYQAAVEDHTGAIGIDVRNSLMEELVKVDEARGKLDQKKGRLILEHGAKVLQTAGIKKINLIHRRDGLPEAIKEMEHTVDMIFIGKRGEQATPDSEFLGSNLERVARLVHKPLFVVSRFARSINRFAIAYDGKENANKAVEYAASSPLLKKLECHLLTVDPSDQVDTQAAIDKLSKAGFAVKVSHQKADYVDQAIASYVAEYKIDLILTGAYSHSRVRNILLGSTTASLIKTCHVPLILWGNIT